MRTTPRGPASRAAVLAREVRRHHPYYLLTLPALAFFVLVNYVPMGGIVIAFKQYSATAGIWGSRWVGLRYFERMVRSPDFFSVFRNTVVISLVKLLLVFPAPIIFALLLNEVGNLGLKRVFQTISYLPHFISWVVAAGLIREFLSLRGPVNYVIGLLGSPTVGFLQSEGLFVPLVVVSAIWKTVGWGSIVYLAAITGISAELYDAAQIDGAGRVRRILHITLPSIVPVIIVLFLLRVGDILNAGFDQIFNLYSPMVYSVGDIIDTYVYRQGLVGMQFSYSAAVGLSKNLVGLVVLLVMNNVVSRLGGRGTVL